MNTKNLKNEAGQNDQNVPQSGINVNNVVLRKVKLSELRDHPKLVGLYPGSMEVSTLMESIKKHGLVHNIVTTPSLETLAGYRRRRALEILGIKEVTVEIVDIPEDQVLEFGIASNQSREKTILHERNEVMSLFELYSQGQGKDAGGNNTVKKIRNITGMSEYKISSIRSIEEYAPELFDKMDKGMSLKAAYDIAMAIKKDQDLCKRLNKEYKPAKEIKEKKASFEEDLKQYLELVDPDYVKMIEEKAITPVEAYNQVVLNTDRKKPKPVEKKCECPFCNSKVETQKIQRLINLGAEKIEQLLAELKEREIA